MPHLKTDRRPAATQTRYVAEYTVVNITEITKDDRKLTRPRLETAQFEDAGISSELHSRGRSPHQQDHGEENAEQLRYKYTALLRAM